MARLRQLFGAALLLALAMTVAASGNSAQRTATFSQLPDWRGVWVLVGSTETMDGRRGDSAITAAPYNAEWQRQYATARANSPGLRDSYQRYCYAGVPRMMASPQQLMFVIAPEETVVLGSRHDIRHLWTDGRQHPPSDELWPMFWGDSIAYWEGGTLVVSTIALRGELWLDPTGARISDQAQLTERISSPRPGLLRNQMTIVDPVALTKPWNFVRTYRRTLNDDLTEEDCQWRAGSAAKAGK
jgi:hypothetical protein